MGNERVKEELKEDFSALQTGSHWLGSGCADQALPVAKLVTNSSPKPGHLGHFSAGQKRKSKTGKRI
jgi:hypothetical protein